MISKFLRSIGAAQAPNPSPAAAAEFSVPAQEPTGARVLTASDQIPIPEMMRGYMLLVEDNGRVTAYVFKDYAGDGAFGSVLQALDNRRDRFHSVETKLVELDELTRLQRQHQISDTKTYSIERRAIQMLRTCAAMRASDARLKPYQESAGLEMRVNGDMTDRVEQLSKKDLDALCFALWNMSDSTSRRGNYSGAEGGQAAIVQGLGKYELDDVFAAIRLNFTSSFLGPECIIRFQSLAHTAKPLDTLGIPAPVIIPLRQATSMRGGAIFFSGPMGSGKTNLLASTILDHVLRWPTKTCGTIEDPVEIFIHDKVSQWPITATDDEGRIRQYVDLTRRALRSDYQLLMLGECRDSIAARAAMQAAVTGLIMLSTIHTPSPMKIIRRLANFGVPEVELTDPEIMIGLGGVRLVKALCTCKIPVAKAIREEHSRGRDLSDAVARMQRHADHAFNLRGLEAPRLIDGYTRNHAGCDVCRAHPSAKAGVLGTAGRTQLLEFITPDAKLLELLFHGNGDAANHHARAMLGIPSIDEDAIDRIAAGQVCPLDVLAELGGFKDPKRFAAHDILASHGAAQ